MFFVPSSNLEYKKKVKILHSEPHCSHVIGKELLDRLKEVPLERDIIIVCVGTDRSTGDALGPLVGSKIEKISSVPVFGTLEDPVQATNLTEKIKYIYDTYNDPYIIAVDACLGELSSIGLVQLGEGPLKPGAGVNKDLPYIGDIHLVGIVNVSGFMEYFVLQNTRLNFVMKMADAIVSSLLFAINSHHNISE